MHQFISFSHRELQVVPEREGEMERKDQLELEEELEHQDPVD